MSKYTKIVIIGFVLWISETAYFGFNATPENAIESTLDFISGVLIAWGILGDLLSNVTIVKKTYSRSNTNIDKVEKFIVENPKVNLKTRHK